jgi:hypothetical protein
MYAALILDYAKVEQLGGSFRVHKIGFWKHRSQKWWYNLLVLFLVWLVYLHNETLTKNLHHLVL